MKVRALSTDGDMRFGRSAIDFLANTPETVAQVVRTRLLLLTGEWFLDQTSGTDYAGRILGAHTQATYDQAIRERILGTQGVLGIADYSSTLTNRRLSVSATIDTAYGLAALALQGIAPAVLPISLLRDQLDFRNPDNSIYLPIIV
jgi:CubicO group peptidase (beta-lactamase class C family)